MVQSENHAAVRRSGPLPSPPPPRAPHASLRPLSRSPARCTWRFSLSRTQAVPRQLGADRVPSGTPLHGTASPAAPGAPHATDAVASDRHPDDAVASDRHPETLWHQPPPQSQHLCPAGTLLAFATRPEARARAPFPHVTCPPWQGRPPRSPAPRGVCRPTCLLSPLAELMNLRYSGKWDQCVVSACYSVLSEAVDTSSRLAVGLEFLSRGLYPAQRRLPVFRRLC